MVSVTLFKSVTGEDNDNFAQTLHNHVTSIKILPVLAFEFVSTGLHELKYDLNENSSNFSGLILTSPRCVESLTQAIEFKYENDNNDNDDVNQRQDKEDDKEIKNKKDELLKTWLKKSIYCVGPATLNKVQEFFNIEQNDDGQKFSNFFTSEQGNSESLGKTIVQESKRNPITLPLLYPCGSLKTDKLGHILSESNVPYKTITVYNTVKNPKLETNLLETSTSENEVYVFFSPSGLNFALPHLTNLHIKKFVALGPTTKEALEKVQGIPKENIYQCPEPTPNGLLQIIQLLSER